MGIKQLYNDNLQKLPNEYRDISVKWISVSKFFFFSQDEAKKEEQVEEQKEEQKEEDGQKEQAEGETKQEEHSEEKKEEQTTEEQKTEGETEQVRLKEFFVSFSTASTFEPHWAKNKIFFCFPIPDRPIENGPDSKKKFHEFYQHLYFPVRGVFCTIF